MDAKPARTHENLKQHSSLSQNVQAGVDMISKVYVKNDFIIG